MPKSTTDAQPAKKPDPFHWEIRPEPAATPRDRRWLAVSLAALLSWLAVLVWLAYR
jgi:hypothetical protein